MERSKIAGFQLRSRSICETAVSLIKKEKGNEERKGKERRNIRRSVFCYLFNIFPVQLSRDRLRSDRQDM